MSGSTRVTSAGPPPPVPDPPAPAGRAWGELGLVALLAVIGVVLLVDTGRIAVPGSSNTVGPRAFPYAVGAALVLVAVALAVAVWRGDRAAADEGEDVDASTDTDWRAVGLIAAAFVAHALLINVVGWPLAVSLMFASVSKLLGARGWVRPLLAGGVVSVVVWLLFVKLLNVALPGGTLLELVTGA
ncbi:MAG TPA: tripartite tricarboxylate transporter TctB family protein [Mycobacteriales bacterium]|jgi:putative tricarboxylic transport membrane protein|nr:tripartite tricarboxylate transporter TctB family protein [Mycobacteriales bacterium]